MVEQESELQKTQRLFNQRLEAANTLKEVQSLFSEVYEARDMVGRGYAINCANSLCAAAASATRTRPEVVSEIIDKLVLPFIELKKDADDESVRFLIDLDYLRKNVSQWIYQYPYDEMSAVRESVLSVLEKRLRITPQDSFFWCVSQIGFRNDPIEKLLWELANSNEKYAAIAARTLIATGLNETERDSVLDLVKSQIGKTSFVELTQLAIQELVGPKRMQIAVDYLHEVFRQKESTHPLGRSLAISVATRAVERCEDDATIHEEIWSMVNQSGNEVVQSGEYGFRCNSSDVVGDYFARFTGEMRQEKSERGHLDYIFLSRLQELVKPAHLRGWRKFKDEEVVKWLETIASQDTGHRGQFTTTSSELKPLAMATLLELGFQPDKAFIEKSVAEESSGFVVQNVAKLLACTRVHELPSSILELVSECRQDTGRIQEGDNTDSEYFCQQLGLIELVQACRSRNAFEALLSFGFTYDGGVLMATVDAICELAIARIEEGDDDVVERLLGIIQHSENKNHREAAVSVFCRLCWSGYVHGENLNQLVSFAQDETLEAFTRSEVLEAIARTDFKVTDDSKTDLWLLSDSDDETLRWRSLEVFIKRDWLDEAAEQLVLERIQLSPSGNRMAVTEPESLLGWQAYLLGILYQKNVGRYAPAISAAFDRARADVFYQLIRPVKRVGDANPAKVIAALASRIRSLNTSYSTDTGLFSVLAELSPKYLMDLIESNQWHDWRMEGRAALCEAAEIALRHLPSCDTLLCLLPFIKDSSFQVRRSAYRLLGRVDHERLFISCRLWADSGDMEWERRAAESTLWLPTRLYSDDMLRAMEFQGHREPSVREAFDGVLLRRRQRKWNEDYLETLFSVCRSDSFDVAEAFRLSRAIGKLGDDETVKRIDQFIASSALPIAARNVLKRTKKQVEKQWKQTTAKWPEP